MWDGDAQEERREVLLGKMPESSEQKEGPAMTHAPTKPDKWSQFSDRQLVELCCKKTNGLPTQFLGMSKVELISLVKHYTAGDGNALV